MSLVRDKAELVIIKIHIPFIDQLPLWLTCCSGVGV